MIRGVHDFENGPAIVAGDDGLFVLAHAFDEMFQFLGIALVERLLENREGPAFGGAGLFHRVTISFFAVSQRGVAHEQVGIDHAGVAINLDTVVHAAVLRPTVLRHADRAALELDYTYRIHLGARAFLVNQAALHVRIDAADFWSAAEHPP